MNLPSLSHGGNCKQDRPEVPEHPDGDNSDAKEDKKSPSDAAEQEEEDEDDPVPLVRCTPPAESQSLTITKEMEEIFLRLGFSLTVAMKLVDDQGIDSPWTLASLSDKEIANICNVIRRAWRFSEWEDSIQGEPDFYPGHKEFQAHGIYVQNNGTLLQIL